AARALPRDPPAIVARSPERLADHSPAVLGLDLSEPLPGLVLSILPSVERHHARLVGRRQVRVVRRNVRVPTVLVAGRYTRLVVGQVDIPTQVFFEQVPRYFFFVF